MKNKGFAILILVVICFVITSCSMFGGNSYTFSTKGDATACIRGISDKSYGELTLPLQGETDYGNMRVTVVDANAFEGNKSITSLTVPEGYRRIEEGAFKDCVNLETVKLPSTLEYIAPDAFEGCTKLKYETVGDLVYLDTWLVGNNGSYAESYTVREGTYYIKAGVFYEDGKENDVTKSITLPQSLLRIEEEAFRSCRALEEIVIPGSVKVIPVSAFDFCSSLKKVEIGEGVEEIQKRAFCDCPIEEISIPSTVKNIQTSGVPEVEKVDGFGYADGWLVHYYSSNATYNVTPREGTVGIAGAVFSQKVTSVNVVDSIKYISDEAFAQNRYLLAVTGLEGVEYVGDKAFYECESLASIEFGSKLKEIGESAFSNCEDLKTVGLKNSLEVISNEAFAYCESLGRGGFSLPDSVKWIGAYAFNGSPGVAVRYQGRSGVYVGNWLVQEGMVGATEIPDNSLIGGITGGTVSNDGGLVIKSGTVGIAAGVFNGNRVLKSVTIPSSVKYIGENAFGMNNYDIICENKTGWVAYSRTYDDIKINLSSQQVSNIRSLLFFAYSDLVLVNESN